MATVIQEPLQLPQDGNATGRNFGPQELDNLRQVLASGTLNCTKGTWVRKFEAALAERFGAPAVRCVTSGTAAIHTAIAALDLEVGDEVITTPITDMGAITPIPYQGAIPIFADVDPLTYNVTADTIAARITPRTRAVIVTHLFGNPCDMRDIMALAKQHDLVVIEDAAQAYFATYENQLIGTIGHIACFSLQQGKHMTTGEGGFVVLNDEQYARRVHLFVDKAWGYGDENPDHYFLALNYRMTELQGAVALAQLEKCDEVVDARVRNAQLMDRLLEDVPGVSAPAVTPASTHVYWKYCLRIDDTLLAGGVDAFATALRARGIFSAPRYIKKPAFECEVIRDRRSFGTSQWPWEGAHREGLEPIQYLPETFPGTYDALAHVCVLPWNEFYTEEQVHQIAEAVREVAEELAATHREGGLV